ncbi:MAG: long-chain fatty acid--CoA ligase [Mucilaginibacter polytrichastri]|nr:long-chain fatty acid--CoA ligase [Mucilaginibacter polytrichastri]
MPYPISRVFELLDINQKQYQRKDMVAYRYKKDWTHFSTDEFIETVNDLSYGLLHLGIKKGDKIGIMSPNRPEWNFVDFAAMQIGAAAVPFYPTLSEADIDFILEDSEAKMIFVSSKDLYEKLDKARKQKKAAVELFIFDDEKDIRSWKEMMKAGKENRQPDVMKEIRDSIKSEDLLTLIYTSGTTGRPKGVMLSHGNLVSNFVDSSVMIEPGFERALSFLPLSHIFERMVVYMYFFRGISVYYAKNMDTIVDDIRDVKPHGFATVPRLLEKVYDRIVAKGKELTGVKRKLFFWALDLGLKYELDGKNGWWYEFKLKIVGKLIFSKWREALGGNIISIVSGGAALQQRLARVFWAAGIPVIEGYGLTETSPVIAVNGVKKGATKFGTVGKLIKNVEVKIAEDGELLVKGPNIMQGYYKNDKATAEVMKDGFFATGDIAEYKNGFLKITDRKKEVFKTAGGKYVAPQILENRFKESTLIEQIMVIGENQRFPAALVVPAFDELKKWCAKNGIKASTPEKIIREDAVLEKFTTEIDQYNKSFGHWEQVKKIVLLPKEWSIDGGELTPKLSLKRKVILEKYDDLVKKIYEQTDSPPSQHTKPEAIKIP